VTKWVVGIAYKPDQYLSSLTRAQRYARGTQVSSILGYELKGSFSRIRVTCFSNTEPFWCEGTTDKSKNNTRIVEPKGEEANGLLTQTSRPHPRIVPKRPKTLCETLLGGESRTVMWGGGWFEDLDRVGVGGGGVW